MENENATEHKVSTLVEVIKNGPLRVHGHITVKKSDGTEEVRVSPITSLCRCGLSQNKPYCDGAHKREGFNDEA